MTNFQYTPTRVLEAFELEQVAKAKRLWAVQRMRLQEHMRRRQAWIMERIETRPDRIRKEANETQS